MDIKTYELKEKAILGAFAVSGSRIILQVISSLGGILLTRILVPEIFGLFAITQFVVSLCSVMGGIGIGAAAIQSKDELEAE